MKTFMTLAAVLMFSMPAMAQQETIFDTEMHNSGFGGPVLKLAHIDNNWGLMVGGSGAWYINHTLAIGGAGYGLATDIEGPKLADSARYLDFGYGGGTIEYVVASDNLVHFSVNTLIGAGAVGYRTTRSSELNNGRSTDHDAFFIVEPGANVELNVAKNVRVDLGASYRFVNGVERNGLDNASINGPSANLTMKFGSF